MFFRSHTRHDPKTISIIALLLFFFYRNAVFLHELLCVAQPELGRRFSLDQPCGRDSGKIIIIGDDPAYLRMLEGRLYQGQVCNRWLFVEIRFYLGQIVRDHTYGVHQQRPGKLLFNSRTDLLDDLLSCRNTDGRFLLFKNNLAIFLPGTF